MITTARPLPMSLLMGKSKSEMHEKTIWCGDGQREIITHRSWVSIYLVITFLREKLGRKPILFVPDFFCYETIYQIEDQSKIVFYKVGEDLMPDFANCRQLAQVEQPDAFLAVHYFGKIFDINSAKMFCDQNEAILIEDAAHILLPQKKVGRVADFTIYSPWKHCGLPDGAILLINSRGVLGESAETIYQRIQEIEGTFDVYPKKYILQWRLKKIIQKFVPSFVCAVKEAEEPGTFDSVIKQQLYKVSDYSRAILKSLHKNELLEFGNVKRRNMQIVSAYLRKRYKEECEIEECEEIPYTLVVQTSSQKIRTEISNEFGKIGKVVTTWPDLSDDLPEDSLAVKIKEERLHIAIHDGLKIQKLKKALRITAGNNRVQDLELRRISKEEYQELCRRSDVPLPILQSMVYASAKESAQGWKTAYWEIVKPSDHVIAYFLTLRKYGCVYRINRGPVMLGLSEIQKQNVYGVIKKHLSGHGKILFIAPEDKRSGENMLAMLALGFKQRQAFFSTGFLDLRCGEDELRKKLDSKWRNQLKKAEKALVSVELIQNDEEFEKVLELHRIDKEKRDYQDSGDAITRFLYYNHSMIGMTAENDQGIIVSFVLIALHEKTATYYVGWSNEEGYATNANRLLLWKAMTYLKEQGYEWFDLGGIDLINTRSIAEFKLGTGCVYKELLGEYAAY